MSSTWQEIQERHPPYFGQHRQIQGRTVFPTRRAIGEDGLLTAPVVKRSESPPTPEVLSTRSLNALLQGRKLPPPGHRRLIVNPHPVRRRDLRFHGVKSACPPGVDLGPLLVKLVGKSRNRE